MAGDWIKMRCDLATDPAVISMAAALRLSEDEVVGKLHRFWSWISAQSRSGHARGVTEFWIDRFLSCENFARELRKNGWLKLSEDGIAIPKFDRHNSQSAKTRALARERKDRQRSREERDENVTEPGQERDQRREEYRDDTYISRACESEAAGVETANPPANPPTNPAPIPPGDLRDVEPTPERPSGFPATEDEAAAWCDTVGVPGDVARRLWNELEGTGWRDKSGRLVTSFHRWAKGVYEALRANKAERDARAAGPKREGDWEFKPARRLA